MGIVRSVVEQAVAASPNAVFIIVSNPLDRHVSRCVRCRRHPARAADMHGWCLDSCPRFRCFIAAQADVSVEDVSAMVLGGHGDTMVPISRYSTIAGVPITEIFEPDVVKALEDRTANGGAEIVSLLKTGSAYQAPGASVVEMVDSILLDKAPHSAVQRPPRRRVWAAEPVRRRAGQAGRRWRAPDHRAEPDRRREGCLHKSASAVQDLVDAMARLKSESAATT
jgi:malate/lactate dehydrogenase